jgi:hypothetical protein
VPDAALKEWVSLLKDSLLAIAALVTIFSAVYGVKLWKRELVGKEIYSAARALVRESHLVSRSVRKLREPIRKSEQTLFTPEEAENMAENERWRITAARAYRRRLDAFAADLERYEMAKLDLRVLVGSSIYEGFLPLGPLLLEAVESVKQYLDVIESPDSELTQQSPAVLKAQQALLPAGTTHDRLQVEIENAREHGETTLLEYLHRKSIRG